MRKQYLHKKVFIIAAFIIILLAICWVFMHRPVATPYEKHGALSVKDGKLLDCHGEDVQLKGVSTHGLAWFPEYVNKEAFQTLRDRWGANVIRLSLYTESYGGYVNGGDPEKLRSIIDQGVQYCTELGMYCIIDWHILNDGDPNTHKSEAKQFFYQMVYRYGNQGNVLFEICNEPNGDTTWRQVQTYAYSVLKVIRRRSPRSIVIVGTPNWSRDVDIAARHPLKGQKNIMYAFHVYAASHKDEMRRKLKTALALHLPVFITEIAICESSGNGEIDKTSGNEWKEIIQKHHISWCAWNLSNKDEACALIKPNVKKTSAWFYWDLTEDGKWIRGLMRSR